MNFREGIVKKYLSVVPLVLLFCFVVGCQDKAAMAELEEFTAQAALEAQNKEIVLRYNEAIDSQNFDAAMELLAPDYTYYFPSGVSEPAAREEAIAQVKMFQNAIPDLVHNIEEIVAVGDKVIFRFIARGTNTGEIREMGIPATGNPVEVSSIVIVRVKNGKIVEERQEADMLGFLQQFGMELKPKEAGK